MSSWFIVVTPVTRVPGRASEFTNFSSTGSMMVAMTIGVFLSAYHAAVAIAVAGAKYRSTGMCARSLASGLKRSALFDAERRISCRFLPSAKPSLRRPSRKPRKVAS